MKALNATALNFFLLQTHLGLRRMGWSAVIACLLCVTGAIGLFYLVPHLRAQGALQENALQQMRLKVRNAERDVLPPLPSQEQQHIASYYDALGDSAYAEQQLKTLFAVAGITGLNLNQGEYKSSFDKNSNTQVYQILLPVKGPYPAIRQFCEKVLLAIPFASLDEMSFKREAIGSNTLEAKLRFSLYLGTEQKRHSSHEKGAVLE